MAAAKQKRVPPSKNRPARRQQEGLKTEPFAAVRGMETREQRDAIQAGFWSWLMNVQPIGNRTLRLLYGQKTAIYTASGTTILYYDTGIIGSTYYAFVFLANGKADQVRLSDGTVTHISTSANKFWNGSGAYPHFTNFGNSGIIIVSPLGYWAWDGTTLFSAGDQSPAWLNGLLPTLSTTGTTHTTNVIDGLASTTNVVVGIGVYAADVPAGATVLAINSPTSVTISIAATGSNASEAIVFSFLPSIGTTHTSTTVNGLSSTGGISVGMAAIAADIPAGATVIAIPSGTSVTLSLPATGSNTNENIVFTWLMPTGISGTAIEIYDTTPWIVNGRVIQAAAPGNGANFATSDGAVNISVKDAYVQDGYSGLKANDGFLYLFAHGAVDVISDVQTSGTPPTTTFLRVPVSTKIGTPWRDSIVQSPTSIICANTTGAFEVAGGSIRKISDSMDGIFASATFPVAATDPSGYHPTAAMITLNEVLCYSLTATVTDPDTNITINALLMWDAQRWFMSTQETQPVQIAAVDEDSAFDAWGSDGTTLYQSFAASSATLAKKAKSWFSTGDLGKDGIHWFKMLKRIYAQFGNFPVSLPSLSVTIDTENMSVPIPSIVSNPVALTFIGAGGVPIQFIGSGSANLNFVSASYPLVVAGLIPGIVCLLFAVTFQTSMPTLDIVGVYIGYITYSSWE